jgi:hypothetical protein
VGNGPGVSTTMSVASDTWADQFKGENVATHPHWKPQCAGDRDMRSDVLLRVTGLSGQMYLLLSGGSLIRGPLGAASAVNDER